METIELHRAERNVEAFALAAQHLAVQLEDRGWGEVTLCPGDATAYPFIILGAGREHPTVFESNTNTPDNPMTSRVDSEKNYLVVLNASFGGSYPWAGQPMHYDYCAGKWASDHREWTGHVVAALLNALSPLLEPTT